MKISILDDYHDTLRTLQCFSKLAAHDVTAAGGWRSLQVMRASYMHADAEGVLSAVESRATGPTQGPPDQQAATPQRVTK